MGFFSVQLASIDPHAVRSHHQDIDLLTFAVVVAGREQGHGSALIPVFPGYPIHGNQFNEAASINGLPHSAANMSSDWVIGPLWVDDAERIDVMYAATNTSDSQIPTADQQDVDRWTLKLTGIYLSLLVGEFVGTLGLKAFPEFFGGAQAGGAVAAFLEDPVGTLLGYRPPGPCNGTVFAGKQSFTGAELAARTVTPGTERTWKGDVPIWTAEITESLTDAATHDTDVCGAIAQTDVTLRFTRYENWSLKGWSDRTLEPGVRRMFAPQGGSLKQIFGLRL